MTNSMKSRIAISAALLLVTCLFFATFLQGEVNHSVRVIVPFDFYAGDRMLPAGEYRVSTSVDNLVQVADPAKHLAVNIRTITVDTFLGKITSPRLIFNQYGQDHFLSEVWWGNTSLGRAAMTSKRETELAKTVRPIRIEETSRR